MEGQIDVQKLNKTYKPRSALRQTILEFIDEQIGEIIDPDVLTQQLYNHECRGFVQPQNLEWGCLRAYRGLCKQTLCDPDKGSPLRVKDYEHLCAYYSIKRGTKFVFVPIEQVTKDELIERATLYRGQSAAMLEHADELDVYRERRA